MGAYTSEGFGAYVSGDARVAFMEQLGFRNKQAIEDLATENFFIPVSEEQLDLLDAELTVVFPIFVEASEFTGNPLWQALPSVQEGRAVVLDDTTRAERLLQRIGPRPALRPGHDRPDVRRRPRRLTGSPSTRSGADAGAPVAVHRPGPGCCDQPRDQVGQQRLALGPGGARGVAEDAGRADAADALRPQPRQQRRGSASSPPRRRGPHGPRPVPRATSVTSRCGRRGHRRRPRRTGTRRRPGPPTAAAGRRRAARRGCRRGRSPPAPGRPSARPTGRTRPAGRSAPRCRSRPSRGSPRARRWRRTRAPAPAARRPATRPPRRRPRRPPRCRCPAAGGGRAARPTPAGRRAAAPSGISGQTAPASRGHRRSLGAAGLTPSS